MVYRPDCGRVMPASGTVCSAPDPACGPVEAGTPPTPTALAPAPPCTTLPTGPVWLPVTAAPSPLLPRPMTVRTGLPSAPTVVLLMSCAVMLTVCPAVREAGASSPGATWIHAGTLPDSSEVDTGAVRSGAAPSGS